ncbi:hypothetical protein PtB15_15B350 [Puccinia triticina]|nr:hypothetical protein PtB15_15B350 [Puccinia triticina]
MDSSIAPPPPQESTSVQPPVPSDPSTPPPIKPSSTSPRISTGSSKPPKKQAKKAGSSRPVDLLAKNATNTTESNPSKPANPLTASAQPQNPIAQNALTKNPTIETSVGSLEAPVLTINTSEPHRSQDTSTNPAQASPTPLGQSQVPTMDQHLATDNQENPIAPEFHPSAATETINGQPGVSNNNSAAAVDPSRQEPTGAPKPLPKNSDAPPPASGPDTSSGQPNPTSGGTSTENRSDLARQVPRYQTTWASLTSLVQFRVHSMRTWAPPKPEFHFQRTACSYASWIKTISSLANSFLSPSHNEQWYCPDIIDFPLLATFGNKDKSLPPPAFISTAAKTPHSESTLVCFLYRLAHPTESSIADWAKLVAASVEIMADNLYKPPVPTTHESNDQIIQGVQVLQYIEAIKNHNSTFESVKEDPNSDAQIPQRSHSSDVLHEFLNLILDFLSAYVIFQTHALSEPPQTEVQKKANKRNRAATRKSSDALTQINPESSELAKLRDESTRKLQSYQRRQNYQPLIFFILGGVRGLFLVSKNHRHAVVSDCMEFTQAMAVVKQYSTSSHTPEEPIWKNLSAYIVQIFAPVFRLPNKISHMEKTPTRHEIAEAITLDFLSHWAECQPTSPFLIPHASRQIEDS